MIVSGDDGNVKIDELGRMNGITSKHLVNHLLLRTPGYPSVCSFQDKIWKNEHGFRQDGANYQPMPPTSHRRQRGLKQHRMLCWPPESLRPTSVQSDIETADLWEDAGKLSRYTSYDCLSNHGQVAPVLADILVEVLKVY